MPLYSIAGRKGHGDDVITDKFLLKTDHIGHGESNLTLN